MQAPSKRITAITKSRPDHISLDFDRLRAEGIQHLENLATEVWTDFNAHDPGITTMEVLCYAITDLAYRTRMLPIQDLAAGNGKAKPWYEAYEILPVRPVTPNDLRRLLIDVDGVKNAWVERAKPEDLLIKNAKNEKRYLKKPTLYNLKGSIFQIENGTSSIVAGEVESLVGRFVSPKLADGSVNPAFDTAVADLIPALEDFNPTDAAEQKTWLEGLRTNAKIDQRVLDALLCGYLHPQQETFVVASVPNPDILPLNGIHRVRIELDDHLDPENPKHIQRAVRQALARLHDNRGLCEDFLRPEVGELGLLPLPRH